MGSMISQIIMKLSLNHDLQWLKVGVNLHTCYYEYFPRNKTKKDTKIKVNILILGTGNGNVSNTIGNCQIANDAPGTVHCLPFHIAWMNNFKLLGCWKHYQHVMKFNISTWNFSLYWCLGPYIRISKQSVSSQPSIFWEGMLGLVYLIVVQQWITLHTHFNRFCNKTEPNIIEVIGITDQIRHTRNLAWWIVGATPGVTCWISCSTVLNAVQYWQLSSLLWSVVTPKRSLV